MSAKKMVAIVTDPTHGPQQERDFREKHATSEVIAVRTKDELDDAVKKHGPELNNTIHLVSTLTTVTIERAYRLFDKSEPKKKTA